MSVAEPRLPYAARLVQAREALGLSVQEVADRVGLEFMELYDLEAYDDELLTAVSVRDLGRLCAILHVDPAELLARSSHDLLAASPRLAPAQVAEGLRLHLSSTGMSAAAFANSVGWEVEPLLRDPNALWDLTVDGLRDVCARLGVNWLRALPPNAGDIAV